MKLKGLSGDRPGGVWQMLCCECLWSKSGRYARTDEIAETVALRLAEAYGALHEENPGEEPA